MASGTSSQRGASRSGRTASTPPKGRTGGSSVRARKSNGATASSSPRKPQTASGTTRSSASPARGARRTTSSAARRAVGFPLTPIAVVGTIVLLCWWMYPALKVQYEMGRSVAGLQQQYQSLRKNNASLRAEISDLKTPEGVEKAARESLGLTLPGENVYVVMPSATASGQPVTHASGPKAGRGGKDVVTALLDAVFGVR